MPLELVITEGLFILDGGEWEVTNNVWLVGNDREVMVIDAGHDHAPIVEAVAGRRVTSIASTHGHNDHINSAVALRDEVDAPILLHPDDRMLWDMVYADDAPDRDLAHGATLRAAGHELAVIHTPGHSPGSCCFWDAGSGLMFSGDTLFNGGPGATGRSFSDRPTLLRSIRDMLLVLPDETIVHTGHGDSTTMGSERAGLLDHIARLEVD
ncbi:MAG: MBL fold metallo-hydrolase [bacterium]|nr:MBL fold metallo-hydrolase [bacterium]MYB44599.1 MBL fold metallo-hydrolase [Acidimicrobiia bacterium]